MKAESGKRKAESGKRKAEGGRRKAEGGRRKGCCIRGYLMLSTLHFDLSTLNWVRQLGAVHKKERPSCEGLSGNE